MVPFAASLMLCWPTFVWAQVSIGSLPDTYTQNFNSLASSGTSNTWTNGTTLNGWYARNTANVSDYTTYRAGTGSSSTTGLYSFGTAAGDRALGTLNQNASGDIAYGVLFENNSGSTVQSITVAFTAEQWRRVQTNTKGYQRVTLSYQVSGSVDVSASGLLTGSFTELVEGYLIAGDSTTLAASVELDGNDAANRWAVSVNFPVSLANGQQFFLRFYDDNVGDLDAAVAVDDLSITFSASTVSRISATSDYGIGALLDAGIVDDIPDDTDGIAYTQVSSGDMTTLASLFSDFYGGNYSNAATTAATYNYLVSQVVANGVTYELLRKDNASTYYWGTYITNTVATQDCFALQAPHPRVDSKTGEQAAAVFELSQARDLMISGIDRCTSGTYVSCSGSTSVCTGSSESFRISDPAHNDSTAFHLASEALNSAFPALYFIQLHGFGQEVGDPDFIFSNGTENTPSTDYLVSLDTVFANLLPALTVDLVHIDGATKLKAQTNVFGRVLNNYPNNICTSGTNPTTPSGRFLHLEQYSDFRQYAEYYDDLATIINTAIDCSIPMPLYWYRFSAVRHREGVQLIWQTLMERNVSHFLVERAHDGVSYVTLGQVPANNGWQNQQYSFWDTNILAATAYYRIKAVDIDGSLSYSQVVTVGGTSAVRLFPNPAQDRLTIVGVEPNAQVLFRNALGQIWRQTLQGNEISVRMLPPGIYSVLVGQDWHRLVIE